MTAAEAPPDCPLCPRLVGFRAANQAAHPGFFNGAVPSFLPQGGEAGVRLLIVGLAPGLHGANRTGRPFTGDYAGDLLYATLSRLGLAEGAYDKRPDDGLALKGAAITNAVRCVPPENKPVGAEINTCRSFLAARIESLPQLSAMLALGKIAHDSVVRTLGARVAAHPFGHGTRYDIQGPKGPIALVSSYHCSRYNTNTGRLTEEMFEAAMTKAKEAAGL